MYRDLKTHIFKDQSHNPSSAFLYIYQLSAASTITLIIKFQIDVLVVKVQLMR